MRTILFLLITYLFCQSIASARNYIDINANEMDYAKKYSSTTQYFEAYEKTNNVKNNIKIKDPKIIDFGNTEKYTLSQYNKKIEKDKTEYKKVKDYLYSKNIYRTYQNDFYLIYRIAEKIIRANNLDFVNWRITIDRTNNFNASSGQVNCLVFNSGLLDTFKGNDDALALIVGHEIAHSILGHQEKLVKMRKKAYSKNHGMIAYYKYFSASKKAVLAADIEGTKLIARAGYNLDNARETLGIINGMDYSANKFESTHPSGKERIENYEENSKYFMLDELVKQGQYNIINSDVLKCEKSTSRKSFVILRNELKNKEDYYKPEGKDDVFKRVAYISYTNNDMKKAYKYFKKLTNLNKDDFIPYLYLSYICEYKYNETNKKSFLKKANTYINKAYSLNNKNEYVLEQKENLTKETLNLQLKK